jgi:hypothetical protein
MKPDKPRKVEMNMVESRCESCGMPLDGRKFVWVWREHTGCSKACVEACEAHEQRCDYDFGELSEPMIVDVGRGPQRVDLDPGADE